MNFQVKSNKIRNENTVPWYERKKHIMNDILNDCDDDTVKIQTFCIPLEKFRCYLVEEGVIKKDYDCDLLDSLRNRIEEFFGDIDDDCDINTCEKSYLKEHFGDCYSENDFESIVGSDIISLTAFDVETLSLLSPTWEPLVDAFRALGGTDESEVSNDDDKKKGLVGSKHSHALYNTATISHALEYLHYLTLHRLPAKRKEITNLIERKDDLLNHIKEIDHRFESEEEELQKIRHENLPKNILTGEVDLLKGCDETTLTEEGKMRALATRISLAATKHFNDVWESKIREVFFKSSPLISHSGKVLNKDQTYTIKIWYDIVAYYDSFNSYHHLTSSEPSAALESETVRYSSLESSLPDLRRAIGIKRICETDNDNMNNNDDTGDRNNVNVSCTVGSEQSGVFLPPVISDISPNGIIQDLMEIGGFLDMRLMENSGDKSCAAELSAFASSHTSRTVGSVENIARDLTEKYRNLIRVTIDLLLSCKISSISRLIMDVKDGLVTNDQDHYTLLLASRLTEGTEYLMKLERQKTITQNIIITCDEQIMKLQKVELYQIEFRANIIKENLESRVNENSGFKIRIVW